jgi:hypothetical protein
MDIVLRTLTKLEQHCQHATNDSSGGSNINSSVVETRECGRRRGLDEQLDLIRRLEALTGIIVIDLSTEGIDDATFFVIDSSEPESVGGKFINDRPHAILQHFDDFETNCQFTGVSITSDITDVVNLTFSTHGEQLTVEFDHCYFSALID